MSAVVADPEIESEISAPSTDSRATDNLASMIKKATHSYLDSLDGGEPAQVYELFLSQMEKPLLEVMLNHNNRNQCVTARQLGLARGTLRAKMKKYELF